MFGYKCYGDFLQKYRSEYFFIKVCNCDHVCVRRLNAPRSLDSAGAHGRTSWFLSIMLPSPDFSEQETEERVWETAILFVFMNLAVISYAV